MISSSRAREIDTYFYRDHRARGRHFWIVCAVGTAALLFCEVIQQWSEKVSGSVAVFAVAVTYLALIINYRPYGLSRVATGRVRFSPDKRKILFQIPSLIAAVLLLVVLPKETEAEAVSRRIKRFLNEGRESKATEEATEAVRAGIPLRPDVAQAIPGLPRVGDGSVQIGSGASVPGILQLETGQTFDLAHSLSLVIPAGKYPSNLPWVNSGSVPINAIGVGSDKAFVLQNHPGDPSFVYEGVGKPSLIYGITFAPQKGSESPRSELILLINAATGPVVSNVVVQGFSQSLNRIQWIHTRFTDCDISCSGAWLKLTNVTFDNCHFTFTDGVPSYVRESLENSRGRTISLEFG